MAMPETTFDAAIPYGVTTLAVGIIGATVAVAAAATVIKILGIAAGIIGAYGFLATLICGFVNAGNPQKFREEYSKYAVTMIGSVFADIISKIVTETISQLLDKAFGRNSNAVRIIGI